MSCELFLADSVGLFLANILLSLLISLLFSSSPRSFSYTFSSLNHVFPLCLSLSQLHSCSFCPAQSLFPEQTIILASAPASPPTLQSRTAIIMATPSTEASKSFRDGLAS